MNVIYPTKKAKNPIQNFGVFDIETWGLDAKRFAFGCTKYRDEPVKYWFDKDKMWEYLTSSGKGKKRRGCIWFAHNIQFDIHAFVNNVRTEDELKTLFHKGRFILAEHRKTGIRFYDSLNLFHTKLSKIGEDLGFKKGDTPQKFIDGDEQEITERDKWYCKRDCEILHLAVQKMITFLHSNFGVRLKSTSSGNAYNVFRSNFLDQKVYIDPDLDVAFKSSYFGGRTEVFRKKAEHTTYCYDINSMYPFACQKVHPDPSHMNRTKNKTKILTIIDDDEHFEGVAHVKLYCPESILYPVLPYRQSDKVIFPNGHLEGWYNLNELRFALSRGYELLDVYECVYAPPMCLLGSYMETLYEMRKKAKGYERTLIKYLLNSLYGKFGQMIDDKEWGKWDDEDLAKKYTIFEPIDKDQEWGNWTNGKPTQYAKNTVFAICSYVTSWARILLYQYFEKFKFDILYCDTDSVVTYDNTLETSDELGAMKLEDTLISATFLKPKHYHKNVIKAFGNDFLLLSDIIRIKGVTNPKDIYKTNHIFKRVNKAQESLRRNVVAGEGCEVIKKISLSDDKRIHFADGSSKPITLP